MCTYAWSVKSFSYPTFILACHSNWSCALLEAATCSSMYCLVEHDQDYVICEAWIEGQRNHVVRVKFFYSLGVFCGLAHTSAVVLNDAAMLLFKQKLLVATVNMKHESSGCFRCSSLWNKSAFIYSFWKNLCKMCRSAAYVILRKTKGVWEVIELEIHWCTALADISYRSLLLRSIWTMDVKLFLKSSTTVDYTALTVVLYCFWQQSFPKSLSSVCHCLLEICWEACWNLLILPLMIAGWCVLAMCLSWQIKSCITLQQVSSL